VTEVERTQMASPNILLAQGWTTNDLEISWELKESGRNKQGLLPRLCISLSIHILYFEDVEDLYLGFKSSNDFGDLIGGWIVFA
jgi:hypothetical protein